MPIISKRELDKLRNQQGVYSQLRSSRFRKSLRTLVTNLIEDAFREYVQCHKGKHITQQLEDESWARFKMVLEKYL